MSEVVDLRPTLGWTLSGHARDAAHRRGVSVRDVLTVIAAPELTYTAYNYGPGRWMYKRGDLAVIACPQTRRVVTVLWNTAARWTDEDFAARPHGAQAAPAQGAA